MHPDSNEAFPISRITDSDFLVVITGSGSALPDPERGNASLALLVDDVILQFDCGRRTMENLMLAGINPMKVDYIFFTHLHFDHIASYDYFIISSWIAGRQKPFKVFGPPGTEKMSEGALYGKNHLNVRWWSARVSSEPPAKVKDVESGLVLNTGKFRVTSAETAHWDPSLGTKTLGYRVDSNYGSVAISGDTAPSENMVELARGVDLLIHECTMPDYGMQTGGIFNRQIDTSKSRRGHTTPTELGKIAKKAQVKKLVVTHLPPYMSVKAALEMSSKYYGYSHEPDIWSKFLSAIKKEYKGPIILAKDCLILEID
jgi:ribonuclease Z